MQAAALLLWAWRMDSMGRAKSGFNSSTLLGWVHAPGARCGMFGIRLRLWAVASYSWGAGAERETDLRLGHGWGFGGVGGMRFGRVRMIRGKGLPFAAGFRGVGRALGSFGYWVWVISIIRRRDCQILA